MLEGIPRKNYKMISCCGVEQKKGMGAIKSSKLVEVESEKLSEPAQVYIVIRKAVQN